MPPRRGNCGMLVLSWCLLHVSLLITLCTKALDVISAPCLNHLLWGWQLCLLQFKLNSQYDALLPTTHIFYHFYTLRSKSRNWLKIINFAIFTLHKFINIHQFYHYYFHLKLKFKTLCILSGSFFFLHSLLSSPNEFDVYYSMCCLLVFHFYASINYIWPYFLSLKFLCKN